MPYSKITDGTELEIYVLLLIQNDHPLTLVLVPLPIFSSRDYVSS